MFGHVFDVADQSVLVDLRDVGCLFQHFDGLHDELGKHPEEFFEQFVDDLLAVDVEDVLEFLHHEFPEAKLNFLSDLVLEQGFQLLYL
jgi:hypothetical protein